MSAGEATFAEDHRSWLGYDVVFADGYRWSPTGLGPPLDREEQAAIIRHVCERSGRTVEAVQHR